MMKRLGLVFAAVLGSTVACSASDEAGSSTDNLTSDASAPNADASVDNSDASVPNTDASANPNAACASEPNTNSCAACCESNHPQGVQDLVVAYIGCACQGTGSTTGAAPCATECASTLCAATPQNPDPACETCVNTALDATSGTCYNTVASACYASQDCMDWQICLGNVCGK